MLVFVLVESDLLDLFSNCRIYRLRERDLSLKARASAWLLDPRRRLGMALDRLFVLQGL